MQIPIKKIISSLKETGNVLKTAKKLHISRITVYRWKKKATKIYGYETYLSSRGLKRKSRRPKNIHYKLSTPQKTSILALRGKRHYGARKITYLLHLPLSPQTTHRYLKRKSLITKQKNYRRPLFQNGFAMRPVNTKELGYLQMDTKHVTPELGGLPFTTYEYAAIDILSRYKLGIIMPDISSESASLALEFFLKWFPFKIKYIQTDNGLEFQSTFHETCLKHNLKHYFIHKNSPNENAVIERSFKTDQEEFYFWLEKSPEHLGELNTWFQKYIVGYNTERPHQSLNYKTPSDMVKLYQNVTNVVEP